MRAAVELPTSERRQASSISHSCSTSVSAPQGRLGQRRVSPAKPQVDGDHRAARQPAGARVARSATSSEHVTRTSGAGSGRCVGASPGAATRSVRIRPIRAVVPRGQPVLDRRCRRHRRRPGDRRRHREGVGHHGPFWFAFAGSAVLRLAHIAHADEAALRRDCARSACTVGAEVDMRAIAGQVSGLLGSRRSLMIRFWISLVPSKIVVSRASRQCRSTCRSVV